MAAVQIDDYGPWTTEPAPRRETDLQALQGRLFADVADFLGGRDGYAFAGRFDNMVGAATGVDPDAFERLQERVRNRYPVTVSVGVGTAPTPADALDAASAALRDAGSAQGDRREVLRHRTVGGAGEDDAPDSVTVAHFDVVDATGTYTDQVSPARAGFEIRGAFLELAEHLYAAHDAVVEFVGGDNAIAVCPPLDRGAVDAATDHVRVETGVDLQVGVGRGGTPHAAGDSAKHALEACRRTGDRVRGPWNAADD
jgi:GTP cyclohydrolase IIa